MTERTRSAAETEAVRERLAGELGPGDVVLVSGELGAGKTTLIRGACRALGVSEPVRSPTFTVGYTYAGRVPVSHRLDLYRLADLGQRDPALLEDYLTPERPSRSSSGPPPRSHVSTGSAGESRSGTRAGTNAR